MAEIPAQTLNRLQVWWAGVTPDTQALLEAIYMEAPEAVSRVVSGGEWVADGPEPGLSAQLGSDKDVFSQMDDIPNVQAATFNIGPYQPRPGQAVTVTWTEQNNSKVAMPKYFSDVYVFNEGGDVIAQQRFETAGLDVGATSAEHKFEFTAPDKQGHIRVMVYMNAEGIDMGTGVPSAQGYRNTVGDTASVVAAGDEAADEQNYQLWLMALSYLQSVRGDQGDMAQIADALNYLASDDRLTQEESGQIAKLAPVFAGAGSTAHDQFPTGGEFADKVAMLQGIVGQLQAEKPTQQGRRRLLDALEEVAKRLP
jgi:hypothetical protein